MEKEKKQKRHKFPEGNQYYLLRHISGKPKIFKTPTEMLNHFIRYVKECDQNPWKKNEAVKAGDHFGETVQVPVRTPYTIEGFCAYMGISTNTFKNYSVNEKYSDFFQVTDIIRTIIKANQFEGAMVGVYNSNLTARLNELSDQIIKRNINLNSKEYTVEELKEINQALEKEY